MNEFVRTVLDSHSWIKLMSNEETILLSKIAIDSTARAFAVAHRDVLYYFANLPEAFNFYNNPKSSLDCYNNPIEEERPKPNNTVWHEMKSDKNEQGELITLMVSVDKIKPKYEVKISGQLFTESIEFKDVEIALKYYNQQFNYDTKDNTIASISFDGIDWTYLGTVIKTKINK